MAVSTCRMATRPALPSAMAGRMRLGERMAGEHRHQHRHPPIAIGRPQCGPPSQVRSALIALLSFRPLHTGQCKLDIVHEGKGYDGQTVVCFAASAWTAGSSGSIKMMVILAGHLGEGRAGNGLMSGIAAASGVQRGNLMQRTASLPPTSRESETIRLVEGIVVSLRLTRPAL